MRKFLAVSFLLFIAIASFAQQGSLEKKLIDTSEIKYAEIVKLNNTYPETSQTKKLETKQWLDFAKRWNAASSLGADKYKISYYVYIYLKNGQKRQFTISKSKVQESEWMTYDFKDDAYFDAIWTSIK